MIIHLAAGLLRYIAALSTLLLQAKTLCPSYQTLSPHCIPIVFIASICGFWLFFSFICHLAFPIKYLIVEFSSLKKLSISFATQGFQQVFTQAGMRACGPVSHRMRLIAMSHKVAALHNQYYAILRLSKNVGKTFCLEERAI